MLLSNRTVSVDTDLESIDFIGDSVHQYVKQFEGAAIHGQVHSVFYRCAYLQFHNMLVCVALSELGPGPITLLLKNNCTRFPACFVQGSSASLSTQGLDVNGEHSFRSDAAHIFDSAIQPRIIDRQRLFRLNRLIARLDLPEEGLALSLRPDALPCNSKTILMQYAKPAISALLTDLPVLPLRLNDRSYDQSSKIDGVKISADVKQWVRLLGAGPGLTPSGDDFLSGVLAALHVLGHAATATLIWNDVAETARTATNKISVALLEQAAAGRLSHKVSLLVDALLDDNSTTPARLNLLLGQLGETSGWDWLAGFGLGVNRLLGDPEGLYYSIYCFDVDHRNSESPLVRVH